MRQKTLPRIYVICFIILYLWSSVTRQTTEEMRAMCVASLGPTWTFFHKFGNFLSSKNIHLHPKDLQKNEQRLAQLELENMLLKTEMEKISKTLLSEDRILSQVELVKKLEHIKALDPTLKGKLEKKLQHFVSLISRELVAMPTSVIYRDPSSWGTSLWINVGDEDNQVLGYTVIAKNSPVVLGSNLVGVIDFVGKKQSKVRLITDPAVSPAIRVSRGVVNDFDTQKQLEEIFSKLPTEPQEQYAQAFTQLTELFSQSKTYFLGAKGQLQGSGSTLWRSTGNNLKGIGFNFDFQDSDSYASKNQSILKPGDLIVTSGFDGVFPKDLKIGFVKTVEAPKPGGFVYNIEIKPFVDFNKDLDLLYVLAPVQE